MALDAPHDSILMNKLKTTPVPTQEHPRDGIIRGNDPSSSGIVHWCRNLSPARSIALGCVGGPLLIFVGFPLGVFWLVFGAAASYQIDLWVCWSRRRAYVRRLRTSLHVVHADPLPDGTVRVRLGYRDHGNNILHLSVHEEVVSEETYKALRDHQMPVVGGSREKPLVQWKDFCLVGNASSGVYYSKHVCGKQDHHELSFGTAITFWCFYVVVSILFSGVVYMALFAVLDTELEANAPEEMAVMAGVLVVAVPLASVVAAGWQHHWWVSNQALYYRVVEANDDESTEGLELKEASTDGDTEIGSTEDWTSSSGRTLSSEARLC